MLPDPIRKIAVLRANALGDFIVTLPALHAIRQKYPDAKIILLGKPWHKKFLEESHHGQKRTPVDRVIVLPVTEGLREEPGQKENVEEVALFCREVSKEQFDLLINFHGKGLAANPFIKKMGAKATVGQCCPESEKLDYSLDFYYYQSEVMRYLEIVSLIGVPPVLSEPEIKILSVDKQEARSFLKKKSLKNFIVIHACGNDIRRMWNLKKYAALADQLSKAGYQVLFTGAEEEKESIEIILSSAKSSAINAAGCFSLGGFCALLAASSLVISVDTGPLHLARAVGAKTVGMYWAPNIVNWGPLTRKNHRPVISWKMQCPECGITPNIPYPFEPVTDACDHSYSFIEDITVEEVMKEAEQLMASKRTFVD